MAAELRWILLGLSLPLLAGIWWWTARRAGRTPGNTELRESSVARPAEARTAEVRPALDPRYADSDDDLDAGRDAGQREPRDWGVPPFEPLNIRTAEYDHVPVLDGPMMVHADPMPALQAMPVPTASPARTARSRETSQPPETVLSAEISFSPEISAPPAPAPPPAAAADLQRIVTIRVCAVGEARWPGSRLMAALETHGLAFGRYQVFHRKHTDGRSLFCVASLIEPGTFDVAEMPDQEFRGVTLFAVLPGPIEPLDTMDELFGTARGLAEELSGMVQDGKGMPMSPQRAAALREDIARFQARMPRN
ncbi:MAG: cell division protein ZipA C-terminal FtsZ-binding domain-containing protein [Steroidobacteraceae bacterium]